MIFLIYSSEEVEALGAFASLDDESLKLLKKWTARDKIAKLRSAFCGAMESEENSEDAFEFSSYEDMLDPKDNSSVEKC